MMIVIPMPPFLGFAAQLFGGAMWASGSAAISKLSAPRRSYSYRMLLGLGTDVGMLTAIATTVITTAIAVP